MNCAVTLSPDLSLVSSLKTYLNRLFPDLGMISFASYSRNGLASHGCDLVFVDLRLPAEHVFKALNDCRVSSRYVVLISELGVFPGWLSKSGIRFVGVLSLPLHEEEFLSIMAGYRPPAEKISSRFKSYRSLLNSAQLNYVALPVPDELKYIAVDKIVQIHCHDEQCTVILQGGKIVQVRKSMKEVMKMVGNRQFLQVMPKVSVNLSHVRRLNRGGKTSVEMSTTDLITISEKVRPQLIERLSNLEGWN